MIGNELTFYSIFTGNSTNKVVKKHHIKNELLISCDLGPRRVSLIWALYLGLLVVGIELMIESLLEKQVPRGTNDSDTLI